MTAWHWLLHFLGVRPRQPSGAYNWWSGAGSDLGELTLIGIAAGAWRHANCHTARCWRLGRHPVDGTPYKTCRRHHPTIADKAPTSTEIQHAHREANRGR